MFPLNALKNILICLYALRTYQSKSASPTKLPNKNNSLAVADKLSVFDHFVGLLLKGLTILAFFSFYASLFKLFYSIQYKEWLFGCF